MKLELKPELLKDYSIWVGIPMYGGMTHGLNAKGCIDLQRQCMEMGVRVNFDHLYNESLIPRARNYITDNFMKSDFTHLMFIDADIGFNGRSVLELLQMQVTGPNPKDVIGAIYPKKSIAWEKVIKAVKVGRGDKNPFDLRFYTADYVVNFLPGTPQIYLDRPMPVAELGTGFMMIPRSAFETYRDAYPESRYRPDHLRSKEHNGETLITAYFDCGIDPDSLRYLSEDYYFCYRLRKLGINIHICPWIGLAHIGSYVFTGSLGELIKLDVSPTADATSNPKHYTKDNKSIKNRKVVRH